MSFENMDLKDDEIYKLIIELYDDEKLFKVCKIPLKKKANEWIEKLGEVKDKEKKTMIEKIKKQVKDAKEIMFQMFESKGSSKIDSNKKIGFK
jgi:hypothetical protein